MNLVVRHVEAADVPACFKLWRLLVAEEQSTFKDGAAYPVIDLDDQDQVMPYFNRYARDMMDPDCRFWCAEVDGHIAGFLLAYLYEREQGLPRTFIQVGQMYVLPAFRGKPLVAKVLEQAVEEWAKETRTDVLQLDCVGTEKQIKRWTRKGFTPFAVSMYRRAKWTEVQ